MSFDVSYTEKDGYAILTYEGKTYRSKYPVSYCNGKKYNPSKFAGYKKCEKLYNYTFTVFSKYNTVFDCNFDNMKNGENFYIKEEETFLKLMSDYEKVYTERKIRQQEYRMAKEAELKRKEEEEEVKKRIFLIKGSTTPTNPWKKI